MKECYKCQIKKDLEEFYNCSRNQDGKQAECKVCRQKIGREARVKKAFLLKRIYSPKVGISPEKELEIINFYLKVGSSRKTGSNFNISKVTVMKIIKKHKIKFNAKQNQRKHKILNEDYFEKIDTERKAYFLGLLWADGCNFRKTVKNKIAYQTVISLQERDGYILSLLATEIYGNDAILKKINKKSTPGFNRQPQYFLRIPSKKMSDDLINLGMNPRKSSTCSWPLNLPQDLERHFLRGVIDGDGCVCYNTNSLNFTCSITVSPAFCHAFKSKYKKFFKFSNCDLNNYGFPLKSIIFHGNFSTFLFLNWVYAYSSVFLTRKKQKYDLLSNLIEGKFYSI
jgi:hypothetical protein